MSGWVWFHRSTVFCVPGTQEVKVRSTLVPGAAGWQAAASGAAAPPGSPPPPPPPPHAAVTATVATAAATASNRVARVMRIGRFLSRSSAIGRGLGERTQPHLLTCQQVVRVTPAPTGRAVTLREDPVNPAPVYRTCMGRGSSVPIVELASSSPLHGSPSARRKVHEHVRLAPLGAVLRRRARARLGLLRGQGRLRRHPHRSLRVR